MMRFSTILFTIYLHFSQLCLAQNEDSNQFKNFTIAFRDSHLVDPNANFLRSGLQAIFLHDSTPDDNWIKVTTQEYRVTIPPSIWVDTCDEWAANINIKELSLLYIYNKSYYQKNICVFGKGCDSKQIAIIQQAKNESGDWKDLIDESMPKFLGNTENYILGSNEALYILFKFPKGNFKTDFRFKILINSPPGFPKNIYIYSDIYKGNIDRSLLNAGRNQE